MPFRFNLPYSEWLRLRKQVTTKAGEDVRRVEPSITSVQTDISKCKIVYLELPCRNDNVSPRSQRLPTKIPQWQAEIPPLKLFVWTVPDSSQTIQVAAIALGCPLERGGQSLSAEDSGCRA